MPFCPRCGAVHTGPERYCPVDGLRLRRRRGPYDLVGRVVGDRYRLVSRIGAGGFGAVFLAEHERVPRKLAVKVLAPLLARDEVWVRRFEREVQATAILEHPHIVEVIDFGHDESVGYYFVMEHLDGEDLRSVINRSGPPNIVDTMTVMRQVTSALDAAHKTGVVHRDVKCANIFLVPSPAGVDLISTMLLDFGVAAVTWPQGRMQRLAGDTGDAGLVLGSPTTMSPEQIRGEEVDARSDVYSLGVVFFRALTGAVPYSSDVVEDIWKLHIEAPIPAPSTFAAAAWAPPELDALVRQMLAKHRDDRPESAGEVMLQLDRMAEHVERCWAKQYMLSFDGEASQRLRCGITGHDVTQPSDTVVDEAPPKAMAEPAHARSQTGRSVTPTPTEARPMVLAVDDDAGMRSFIRRLIHRKGYRCEVVESGRAALSWLERHPEPDAIVLDFLMPGLGGVDLIRALRTRGCHAPVIVWSGLDSATVTRQVKDQGVADVLDKYDDIHRIGDVLAELVGEGG